MKKIFYLMKNFVFLNKNEKNFCKLLNKISNQKKNVEIVLFNAGDNYYDLCFSYLLKKEKKYKNKTFLLYRPFLSFHKKNYDKNLFQFIFFFFLNNLILIIKNLKWKKLYSKISDKFISFNNYNIFEEIKLLKISKKEIYKLDSKKDLLKLRYKGIKVGDLIYDTYLRFKNRPTVNLKDPFLIEIFAKIIFAHKILTKNFPQNYSISYFTNQLSYIHHGLPARYFLDKKREVKYFGGKASYLSNYRLNNYWHSHDFRKFPNIFNKLKNKESKIAAAKKLLKDKFGGKIIPQEYSILNKSAYKDDNKKLKNFKAIIFLHCFVDAPTGRGKCLFNDFYEWTDETLSFLEQNNLAENIAVKPHPNSRDNSIQTEKEFKKKYPSFIWLDKSVSNKNIFANKPWLGISAFGSVLPELAYHDIFCLAASTHPSMAYNFVYQPKTKNQYFDKILQAMKTKKKLKVKSRNKIYEYIYCDFLKDDNNELLAKKIKLKEWNFTKSLVLNKFIASLKKLNI